MTNHTGKFFMRSYMMALSLGIGSVLTLSPVHAGTMVEDLIAEQNPCKELKAQLMGSQIGIDKVKQVKVNHANLALNGNDVKVDLSGSLACETGPSSMVEGDASADLKASAAASLTDCKVNSVSVKLSNFGGTFRDILVALQPSLQQSLQQEIKTRVEEGCKEFRAGSGTKSASK